jgi:hypothetical protein
VTGANARTGTTLSPRGNTSLVSLPAGAGRSGRAGGQSPGRVERQAGSALTPEESPSPGGGLVSCAITVRGHEKDADWSIAGLWRPAFPGAELVGAAADLLPAIRETGGRDATLGERPRWEVVVSPGVIRVRTRDYARVDRNCQRLEQHRRAAVDMASTFLRDGQNVPEALPTRGTIVAWSAKSRARLVARLSDLDYTLWRAKTRFGAMTRCFSDRIRLRAGTR